MLRIFITLSLFFVFAGELFSQKAEISGKITDAESGEALIGATILLDGKGITITNPEGNYSIEADSGKHTLNFRYISFNEKSLVLYFKNGEKKTLNISLYPSRTELNAVVVSAGKFEQKIEEVTVSMEVLKPKLVEARNTTSMDDALQHVGGVSIIDGQANIRGGSGWSYGAGSRVQILVDDLPQLTADANDTKWSFLPVENLEQIEVIKGASSVLFGSSAMNGVINIRTAYPKEKPLTKLNVFTGFYDHAPYTLNDTSYKADWWGSIPQMYSGLNFLHSRRIGRLDLVVGGNMFLDEGYRKGEYENRARINANLRYRFKKPEGLSLGVNVNSMKTEGTLFFIWINDTSGAYLPAKNTLSDYTTYRTNVDPYLTWFDKKGNTHKIRTRWFNTTNQNNTSQNSKADLYYGEYQYQHRFKEKLTITAGLVEQGSKVRSELYGDHDGSQGAAYLQGDFHQGRLSISAGARVEQNKVDSVKDDWTPVFRSGINFRLFKATYLRASYGQGYRFPSIAEKFVKTSVGNLVIFPNPELESEKGNSGEFGLRQLFNAGSWSAFLDVAAFENRYYNMMEFGFAQWGAAGTQFNGNGFKSLNVGDTRIRGIDVSAMAQGNVYRDLKCSFSAGYTYIDPLQLNYDSTYVVKIGAGNQLGSDSSDFLKYRYSHLLKADLELAWRRISIGMSLRYHSRMVNIDKIFINGLLDIAFGQSLGIAHYRNARTKGDAIFDLRSSFSLTKDLSISFIVKNLFNHIYMERPADMQPPRIYVVQAGLSF